MKKIGFVIRMLVVVLAAACAMQTISAFRPDGKLVRAEEELRGVWVSSVWNLDYPSVPSTDPEVLRAELTAMMDKIQELGVNAVFFQVRPAADALYDSSVFPWSKYLTGEQGRAPGGGFDPLEFAVTAAHERGLSLHAWVNPYRVTASENENTRLSPDNPASLHPDWVVTHTDGKLYFDPGRPEVEELVLSGVREILDRYAVDGIHLDDYFYPGTDFPDEATYLAYGEGYDEIADWRRANVDRLIQRIHALTEQREGVQFGVSPSGIWANKTSNPLGSATAGRQGYYTSCADSRGWVKKGYVDYLIPQVYWNIGLEIADFQVLADWWADVAKGTEVKMYLGLAAYRQAEAEESDAVWFGENGIRELRNQVALIRRTEGLKGYSMFSYHSISESAELSHMMKELSSGYRISFTDMGNHAWAEEAVGVLAEKGIINGVSRTEFDPARQVNRADFTLMLTRLTGKDAEVTDNFADVTPDQYYYREIGVAKALGIVTGRGDDRFDPTGLVSRQDMAVMAYRVLQAEGKLRHTAGEEALDRFSDAAEIADYAREAVEAFVSSGLLTGSDGQLRPSGNATRAEAAVLLWRIDRLRGE